VFGGGGTCEVNYMRDAKNLPCVRRYRSKEFLPAGVEVTIPLAGNVTTVGAYANGELEKAKSDCERSNRCQGRLSYSKSDDIQLLTGVDIANLIITPGSGTYYFYKDY
jgi:hypothetical protein